MSAGSFQVIAGVEFRTLISTSFDALV